MRALHIAQRGDVIDGWDNDTGTRTLCGRVIHLSEDEYNKVFRDAPVCKTCQKVAGVEPLRQNSRDVRLGPKTAWTWNATTIYWEKP